MERLRANAIDMKPCMYSYKVRAEYVDYVDNVSMKIVVERIAVERVARGHDSLHQQREFWN